MPSYELGQIIYILSNKTQKVIPALVEEEFLHKKLNGNIIKYIVSVGPPNKRKTINLETVDGEIFTSVDDIKKVLVDRLNDFIGELVADTEKLVQNWYKDAKILTEENQNKSNKIDPQSLIEEFSSSSPVSKPVSKVIDNKNSMRAHLRSMTGADEGLLELSPDLETGNEFKIVDVDGTVKNVKVNMNGQ